jgi:hypothetical protein
MKTGVELMPEPLRATLVSVVGALFAATALLAPSFLTVGTDLPAAVTLTVLALAFAAVVRLGSRSMVLVVSAGDSTHPTGDEARPVLTGRATDPVHHPLRPRAPGLA